MLERHGVGYETTGALLCAAGDNPDRLDTEAGYAALCGASPVEISSGKALCAPAHRPMTCSWLSRVRAPRHPRLAFETVSVV